MAVPQIRDRAQSDLCSDETQAAAAFLGDELVFEMTYIRQARFLIATNSKSQCFAAANTKRRVNAKNV